MKILEDYIAFDLEFNQYEGAYQIIQVSAVRFTDGKEVDHYDSYVYTDKPGTKRQISHVLTRM